MRSNREIEKRVQIVKASHVVKEKEAETKSVGKCKGYVDVHLTREEQFKAYVSKKKRALVAEDLFYTSSQHRFHGSLKLWLVESDNAFFANHNQQETNYFVSKNRVVDSKNPNNADQDRTHQNLNKNNEKGIVVRLMNYVLFFSNTFIYENSEKSFF
jgi:hypothetical protein